MVFFVFLCGSMSWSVFLCGFMKDFPLPRSLSVETFLLGLHWLSLSAESGASSKICRKAGFGGLKILVQRRDVWFGVG